MLDFLNLCEQGYLRKQPTPPQTLLLVFVCGIEPATPPEPEKEIPISVAFLGLVRIKPSPVAGPGGMTGV